MHWCFACFESLPEQTVQPKRGRALIWPSVHNDKPHEKDFRTEHEAMPVIKGMKYGANAWQHIRDFKEPYSKVRGKLADKRRCHFCFFINSSALYYCWICRLRRAASKWHLRIRTKDGLISSCTLCRVAIVRPFSLRTEVLQVTKKHTKGWGKLY